MYKIYAVDDIIIISQCDGVSMSERKPTLVPILNVPKHLRKFSNEDNIMPYSRVSKNVGPIPHSGELNN